MIDSFFEWVLTWSTTLGALGSLFLSGGLVFLYHKQRELQENQYISDNTPHVTIENVRATERELSYELAKPLGQIEIEISNIGKGQASALEVEVDSEILDDSTPLELSKIRQELSRTYNNGRSGKDYILKKGNHIQAGEQNVRYEVTPYVGNITSDQDIPSLKGSYNLRNISKAVAECKLGHEISVRNYPDEETEERSFQRLDMEGKGHTEQLFRSGLNLSGLPFDVEEETHIVLSEAAKAELIEDVVDVVPVRVQMRLVYQTPLNETEKLDLIDQIFPSYYRAPEKILFQTGLTPSGYNMLVDDSRYFKQRIFYNITENGSHSDIIQ